MKNGELTAQALKTFGMVMIMLLGVTLLQWLLTTDATKEERSIVWSSLKALGWTVTADRCAVNNVCHRILFDKRIGKLVAVEETASAIIDKYTTFITEQGKVTVKGRIHSVALGQDVWLYKEKNGQQNVACVDQACFQVPYEEHDDNSNSQPSKGQ